MGLNDTPSGNRYTIGLFGPRNVGKSSLVNKLLGQDLVLTSEVAGTTTDPVSKSMELLPIGPVLFVDTAGLDDEGELGLKRVDKSYEALRKCDLALFVLDASRQGGKFSNMAEQFLRESRKRNMPTIVVINKCESVEGPVSHRECFDIPADVPIVCTDALSGSGIEDLKQAIIRCAKQDDTPIGLTDGIVNKGDVVLLVTPIDSAAPKGRLILPQQQVIRDILDKGAMALVVKETEVKAAITALGKTPDIVITDSQAFKSVANDIPSDMPLTSFSIIFARQKGDLAQQLQGARALDTLEAGDRILISEGCTHHRQCNDIGTVKIPKLVRKIQPDVEFDWTSGGEYPRDLSGYKVIIHCGACMLNRREMQYRLGEADTQDIPIANYGMVIAYCNGILERAIRPFGI